MRWPGLRHFGLFAVGLLVVLAGFSISWQTGRVKLGYAENILKGVTPKDKEGTSPPAPRSSLPPPPLSLAELREAAQEALRTCSACSPHRSTWLGWEAEEAAVVPSIMHVVRYGSRPLTFTVSSSTPFPPLQEAVCLKSFLQKQKPQKFYLHTNIVDLSQFGEFWTELYKGVSRNKAERFSLLDPELNLRERMRLVMARDPSEMAILGTPPPHTIFPGKTHASASSSSLYWSLHVLSK